MRKLFLVCSAFAAAVFCTQYGAPLLALALPVFAAVPKGDRRLRLSLVALGLVVGLGWSAAYDALLFTPARQADGRTLRFTAQVTDWPQATSYGYSAQVTLTCETGVLPAVLYLEEGATLQPGYTLSGIAALSRCDPAGADWERYYLSQGILLTGSAQGPVTAAAEDSVRLSLLPQQLAGYFRSRISHLFAPDTGGLLNALLTGDKDGLTPGFTAALSRSGLSHVAAVSGLQVTFAAAVVTALLRGRRKTAAGAGILLVWLCALVLGGGPSVLRAALLWTAAATAPLLGRENDFPTALSAALALLLLRNPFAAHDLGLQLSFSSVVGIALFSVPIYRFFAAHFARRAGLGWSLLRGAARTAAASVAALVFTVPLVALSFNQVSLVAPLANLLVLWAVSLSMLLGLAAVVASPVLPGGAAAAAQLAELPLRFLLRAVPALSDLPFAALTLSSFYFRAWLVFVYAMALLLFVKAGRKGIRPPVPMAACAATLAVAILLNRASFTATDLTVTALDVGQGQSVALHVGDQCVLVDCGGTGYDDPGDVAANYLANLGDSSLELLVLTHYHADHANGVAQLMDRVEVAAVALPDVEPDDPLRQTILRLAEEEGSRVIYVTEHTTLPLGDAHLTLYAPLGDGDANEAGLTILCSAGDFDVLITGDMNATVEKRLIKYGGLPDVELLLAGHHGSRYSTSQELLSAVSPELVFISVGADNPYGHPADEALTRIARSGAKIYRTDLSGDLTVAVTSKKE